MKKALYLGICGSGPENRVVFRSEKTPLPHLFPEYISVIGPFKNYAAAVYMKYHGENNSHCRTTHEAAQLASKDPRYRHQWMNSNWWDTFAGGASAADDKCNYSKRLDEGSYHVWAISSKSNVNRHLGYVADFCNEKGKLSGGLWIRLTQRVVNLREARQACRDHYYANFG